MADTTIHLHNKQTIFARLQAIVHAPVSELDAAVADAYASHARLFAFHPVNEHLTNSAIAKALWQPIRDSFPDAERRDKIVIAGEYRDKNLVCAMGQLQGTFARDWHGIPATHGVASLRYGEVHEVEDGLIVESHVIIDVVDLMLQAGCWPMAKSLGAEHAWQSPATQDGLNLTNVDIETGSAALAVVKKMHAGLMMFDGKNIDSMDHARCWTPNFLWYGPAGIGTSRGLAGFQAHHQIPFLRAFPDRKVANHIANVFDGNYVITGGWPSVVATHSGDGWLGLPATGKRIGMRVMDFYRVEDGLIAENWVPIDIVDIMRQMGVDVFARLAHRRGHPARAL